MIANLGSALVFGSIFWKLGLGQTQINDRVGLLQVIYRGHRLIDRGNRSSLFATRTENHQESERRPAVPLWINYSRNAPHYDITVRE